MRNLHSVLLVVSGLAMATAQVPGIGSCPEKTAMSNFRMEEFMGTWYEVERMFQFLETASRCVAANYTKTPDGKVRVFNHLTSRFTGIERILEGELNTSGDKKDEGKLSVKYSVLPLPIDTEYSILDTDYKSYAVLWHCSSYIPFFNTQNAWVMARERKPSNSVLQKAYGALDKFKITRSGFSKVIQDNCGDEGGNTSPPGNGAVVTPPEQYTEEPIPNSRDSAAVEQVVAAAAPEEPAAVPQAAQNEPVATEERLEESQPVPAVALPQEPYPVKAAEERLKERR